MSTHQIHLFISHSWKYSAHYNTLRDWIFNGRWSFGQASLSFHDFSVPKNSPIHNAPSTLALRRAIYNQIARSHVILIPSGMYSTHSNWIQKEIDGAKGYRKPIIAISPYGQERQSTVVTRNATVTVKWNKQSIIDAIWDQFYHR